MLISVVFLLYTIGYVLNLKSGISDSVLRLHIIGASDSEYDQTLKLCVRDRILRDFSEIFSDCETLSDTESAANKHITEIERSAEDELSKRGCDYSVTAEISKCRFPTKSYGSVTLPQGVYTALNLKIGDAKGQNWWCVMYPPLCINDKTVTMSDSSKEKLKECLTYEEYRMITEKNDFDIKVKFKIAEILGKYFK